GTGCAAVEEPFETGKVLFGGIAARLYIGIKLFRGLIKYRRPGAVRECADHCALHCAVSRAGGVREAIRVTAERTFDALSSDDQQAARRLFLRLVTPGAVMALDARDGLTSGCNSTEGETPTMRLTAIAHHLASRPVRARGSASTRVRKHVGPPASPVGSCGCAHERRPTASRAWVIARLAHVKHGERDMRPARDPGHQHANRSG